MLLGQHVLQRRLGQASWARSGFYLRNDPHTVRGADVAFIHSEKLPAAGLPEGFSSLVPDLVVEVVSPNDRGAEVIAKVAEWLALGLETVWMAYPSARSVHIYTDVRGSRILGGDELLEGRGGLAGFRVPVCALLEG